MVVRVAKVRQPVVKAVMVHSKVAMATKRQHNLVDIQRRNKVVMAIKRQQHPDMGHPLGAATREHQGGRTRLADLGGGG